MKTVFMRFPGGLSKTLTLSYDDGVREDSRFCSILADHELKGTFNLNSGLFPPGDTADYTVEPLLTAADCLKTYDSPLFEVACHTVHHVFLEQLDPAVALEQIIGDRRNLEAMFGRQIHGMAYPYGTYNDTVIELCRMAGIHYCRTVHSTSSFDLPENWLTLHPTCHHKDPKLEELGDRFLALEPMYAPQMFYLWGHSYEFARENNWEIIERFADKMAKKEDIWYATNGEIYDYCQAFDRLQFSADGSMVYNPTATDLWYTISGEPKMIASGCTAVLG